MLLRTVYYLFRHSCPDFCTCMKYFPSGWSKVVRKAYSHSDINSNYFRPKHVKLHLLNFRACWWWEKSRTLLELHHHDQDIHPRMVHTVKESHRSGHTLLVLASSECHLSSGVWVSTPGGRLISPVPTYLPVLESFPVWAKISSRQFQSTRKHCRSTFRPWSRIPCHAHLGGKRVPWLKYIHSKVSQTAGRFSMRKPGVQLCFFGRNSRRYILSGCDWESGQ